MEEKHMHQTLYRKYRPQSLDDVFGQEVIVTILKNQLETNKIAHAYLFTGPRGTGKTSVAKILAKFINCEKEQKPCGNCRFCQMKQEENLDIIEIDAASNNGVEEIRELRRKVNLTPSNGQYKVYIVDEVHMLTTSAFNALLKTLEEPPSYVLFVLATTEPHKVPETILSRCQRMDFKRLNDKAIVNRLEGIVKNEKIKIAEDALTEIARLSQGGMRDAIGLLEQASAYKSKSQITTEDVHIINSSLAKKDLEKLFVAILDNDFANIVAKTDTYYEKGKNVTKILEEIINFMRQCLMVQKTGQKGSEVINRINKTIPYDMLLEETIALNKFLLEMKYDSNPKTLLDIALINLANNIETDYIEDDKQPVIKLLGDEEENEESKEPKRETVPIAPEEKEEVVTKEKDEKEEKTTEKPKENKLTKKERCELETLKRLRVDNTFAKVSKKFKNELTKLIQEKKLAIVKEDGKGHLLIDGNIKAASEENQYFIIAFESNASCDVYNKHLLLMEKLLTKQLKMTLRSVAVTEEEWEQYRQEFKEKKREYKFQAENGEAAKLSKKQTKNKNDIEKKYGDLVQKY